MFFEDEKNRLSWTALAQRNVLGPFAPRSGWLSKLSKPPASKETPEVKVDNGKKKSSSLLDKGMIMNSPARIIMQKFLKQQGSFRDEDVKAERKASSSKHKKDYNVAQFCDIFYGTKVTLRATVETNSAPVLRTSPCSASLARLQQRHPKNPQVQVV